MQAKGIGKNEQVIDSISDSIKAKVKKLTLAEFK